MSGPRVTALRAVDLPALRDDFARYATRAPRDWLAKWASDWPEQEERQRQASELGMPSEAIDSTDDDAFWKHSSMMARVLGICELFYVGERMAAVADEAARELHEYPLAAHDFPAEAGVIYFAAGLGAQTDSGDEPAALLWTAHGTVARIDIFHVAPICDHAVSRLGGRPHLMPDACMVLTLDGNDTLAQWGESAGSGLLRLLITTFYLMRQRLAVLATPDLTRAEARTLRRRGHDLLSTRVIALRARASAGPADATKDASARLHQWVVRGHWRKQWYATDQVNRPIWIAPHIKGPEGAPMLGTEKVYALQR